MILVPRGDHRLIRSGLAIAVAAGIVAAVGLTVLAPITSWRSDRSSSDRPDSMLAGSAPGATAATGSKGVAIVDFEFAPHTITVAVGDSVTWSNTDRFDHSLVPADAFTGGPVRSTTPGSTTPGSTAAVGEVFSSGVLAVGDSFQHSFTTVGRFPYRCGIHPSMTGLVIVEPRG